MALYALQRATLARTYQNGLYDMETLGVIGWYALLSIFAGLAGLVMWEKWTRKAGDDDTEDN